MEEQDTCKMEALKNENLELKHIRITKKDKLFRKAKILGIVIGLIVVAGVSYAAFVLTKESTKKNVFKVGALSLILDDLESGLINIENAMPIAMDDASTYSFTIKNNGDYDLDYKVYLEDVPFGSNDVCKVVVLNNEGSKSNTTETTSCDNYRMKDNVIAAKLEKTGTNNEEYSSQTINDVTFVGQKSEDANDIKLINNYTLLSQFAKEDSKRVLDQGTISKETSNNPTTIKYKLSLWIPYPVEYSNDSNENTTTTTTVNNDGSKKYVANEFKTKLTVKAEQKLK